MRTPSPKRLTVGELLDRAEESARAMARHPKGSRPWLRARNMIYHYRHVALLRTREDHAAAAIGRCCDRR